MYDEIIIKCYYIMVLGAKTRRPDQFGPLQDQWPRGTGLVGKKKEIKLQKAVWRIREKKIRNNRICVQFTEMYNKPLTFKHYNIRVGPNSVQEIYMFDFSTTCFCFFFSEHHFSIRNIIPIFDFGWTKRTK